MCEKYASQNPPKTYLHTHTLGNKDNLFDFNHSIYHYLLETKLKS